MRESCPWWCREILVEAGKTSCFAFRDLTHANGGSVGKSVNHEDHEGTRRKTPETKAFVVLRVLGG
jgi:hypothetical protein